ncbi:MAG: TetR/AcrR family transcriptional regulator [Thermoleophilia bacterium]
MTPDPVKPRRAYVSPRRREQAEGTRRAILEAAERRFLQDGWAATTMAGVAREAGVAQRTPYVVFGTKAGLLRELWHLRLRGDEGPAPMGERDWFRALLAEPDPRRALAGMAAVSRQVKERAGGLLEVIRAGADGDDEVAALWGRINGGFHELLSGLTEALGSRGALRAGLARDEATDVMWALVHPDLWQLLVVRRGWSPERYEGWLAGALVRELLG